MMKYKLQSKFKDKYEHEILITLNNKGCNSGLGTFYGEQAILDFSCKYIFL